MRSGETSEEKQEEIGSTYNMFNYRINEKFSAQRPLVSIAFVDEVIVIMPLGRLRAEESCCIESSFSGIKVNELVGQQKHGSLLPYVILR